MPKVTYTAAKGLVQEAGSGIALTTNSLSFSSLPFSPLQAKTDDATITSPGVYTITGTPAKAMTMPTADSFPGGIFIFRSLSAAAHYLTGSAETGGTKVFKGIQSGSLVPQDQGSKLALAAIAGASVSLISDGKSYMVMASSGTIAISQA